MNENDAPRSEYFNPYERQEAQDRLNQMLSDISEINNTEVSLVDNQGNPLPITDSENRIEMRSFYTKVGGPYSKTQDSQKTQDLQLIKELERGFAHVDDFPDKEARLKEWKEKRRLEDARLAESVATIILHKALGPNYLVMKSSVYDDYVNGVDTIVFDKYTGEIVCTFDEVFDSEALLGNKRYDKKLAQVTEAGTDTGGVNIKYGLTLDVVSGQYIRTAVQDVPLICLNINRDSLHKLLRQYNKSNDQSSFELDVLRRIVGDIQKQKDEILEKSKKYKIHRDLEEIDKLIEQLQTHI
jgi:hypothetical protein